MRAWYFSENAYPYLPDASTYDSIRVSLPSKYYDPKVGADLYHRYLDEWQVADDCGLEVMVNEHHQTATNLNPSASVVLGALARITKRARILILGNPIANRRDPIRLAEEMAMVDNYARGRLEVGFVRGVPYEVFAANSSPVRMTDRLWEAHDLILKSWTATDGPFNWEGKYFHYRSVNVWPRPYQVPHPPIWITANSPGQVDRTAELGHTCAVFLTGYDGTKTIFGRYRAKRAELGLPMLEQRLAYAALVYVGDTDEAGFAGARKLMWYMTANKVPPQYRNPPGYSSLASSVAQMKGGAFLFDRNQPIEACIEQGIVFAGNPDTVYAQIKRHYDAVGGYGNLLVMGQAGFLEHDETVRGIETFARELYPRLRELGVVATAASGS
ncbi:MAG TPA: LLM class flavin-dependent oxidoreductase [Candidatus Binatia bacterium]|nr:LLM class flavin-dependent oxidoreductase [Candidatus Binatia bacterium]